MLTVVRKQWSMNTFKGKPMPETKKLTGRMCQVRGIERHTMTVSELPNDFRSSEILDGRTLFDIKRRRLRKVKTRSADTSVSE